VRIILILAHSVRTLAHTRRMRFNFDCKCPQRPRLRTLLQSSGHEVMCNFIILWGKLESYGVKPNLERIRQSNPCLLQQCARSSELISSNFVLCSFRPHDWMLFATYLYRLLIWSSNFLDVLSDLLQDLRSYQVQFPEGLFVLDCSVNCYLASFKSLLLLINFTEELDTLHHNWFIFLLITCV